jgi:hypothetical protein
VEQHTAKGSELGIGGFNLIPPGSDDFEMYGTDEVVERARKWAFDQRYLLLDGSADRCVHGLYRMDVCTFSVCRSVGMDHTRIWVQGDGRGAFILTHPYVDEIPDEMRIYARMHGLGIDSYQFDRWYNDSALPIRMTIPANWPLWPIERDAALVLHTQPILWPDDDED